MVRPFCNTQINLALRKKIASHLVTRYSTTVAIALKFIPNVISEWGRLKLLDGGDLIGSCGLSHDTTRRRDKSFVKYTLEVDRNMCYRNRPVDFEKRSYYGQVIHFLVLSLPSTCPFVPADPTCTAGRPSSLILAAITPIKPMTQSANGLRMPSYTELGPIEVVDASTIDCVVGRVKDRHTWTIIERHSIIQTLDDPELMATGNPTRGDQE
ncbi:hypothetical protein BD779DRAFT_1476550 [Infundibulicybe gibba]|nr:hypothetical protein BD779DRAFT_1476550 [Infundibulicybe gibba]